MLTALSSWYSPYSSPAVSTPGSCVFGGSAQMLQACHHKIRHKADKKLLQINTLFFMYVV